MHTETGLAAWHRVHPRMLKFRDIFGRVKGWARILPMGGALLAPLGVPAAPDWLPETIPSAPEEGPALTVRDYLTPEQADAVHHAVLRAFPDRESWDTHADELRQHLQAGAGLEPWPERTPLHPIVGEPREYEGYSVRNVAFESVPGYWVTGNLYTPTEAEPPYAAVLNTHGHSSAHDGPEGWIKHGRFKADVQLRAAALARMGAVALTIDMFGYGDQIVQLGPDAHRTPIALRMQLWNAMRALDFLEGLDGVDPDRLAVTGHSGGGTQAFLLSALDPRVAVNVPVAMVSGWFFGGCPCESGLPIHRSDEHFANNAIITALTAPRPLLVVSDGGDWTHLVPEIEYPFLESIYGYYDATGNLANVHLPDEGHNYGFSKRAAMYPFMAEHLGLELSAILDSSGAINESMITIEDPALMHVFDPTNPPPVNALSDAKAIAATLRRLQTSE